MWFVFYAYMYIHDISFSDNDRQYRIAYVSVVVLWILTCGTSVLLWYLYKGISGWCNSKNKYNLNGT